MSDSQPFARDHDLLRGSSFFDSRWYLDHYPDVAAAGLDPVDHYLRAGATEGRDPSAQFSTGTYLELRSDLKVAGINPLVHFLRYGLYEIGDDFDRAGINFNIDPDRENGLAAKTEAPENKKTGPLIVFVTHDMNIGGAPVLLMNIGRWFQRHTHFNVRFVSMGGGPLHEQYLDIAPTHIVGSVEIPDDWAPGARSSLKDFLGAEPAFTFANSVASGDYLKINPYKTPTLFYIHEMSKVLDLFPSQLEKIIKLSDHIFCGGRTVYSTLIERGARSDQLTERSAFVPENDGAAPGLADKRRVRQDLGLPATAKIVVACGVAHWRKQPDVFVRLAHELYVQRGQDARLYWIGDGEDVPAMEALAKALGVADRVRFLGFKDNFRDYLAAADVFALTSSEDPFPLVCLDAALACTPSVVFREATGMTAMIEPEGEAAAGIAVPLGDETAYFDAVDGLLRDEELRGALGRQARVRTLARYTDGAACPDLLRKIRLVVGLKPRVSIVLPNYNCGPYLQERLNSIRDQSFKDVEILLLDDKSTDGSEAMLQAFAAENPLSKLMLAERNGGSVFAAWERGIEAATGEIIWMAEADDACAPDFLTRALNAFDRSGVHLVHGRSIPINGRSEIVGDWNDLYLDRLSPGRWHASYTAPAAREVNAALGVGNTIPNASAVLVLRSSAIKSIKVARGFKLAGDWAFYLMASAGGRIAYVHEAVNYHRRHEGTVTKSLEGTTQYFKELADVDALVRRLYGRNPEREQKFAAFLAAEAQRFGYFGEMPAGMPPKSLPAERVPGILYGVGDLSGGGAQMFAIRFVNGWSEIPAPAVLVTMGHESDHPASLARLSPEIPVVSRGEIDAVGIDTFMADWGLDMIATGHWWADRQMGHWLDRAPDHPWAVIMHGCHENILAQPEAFPGYEADFTAIERNCDCFVWTAPKNREVFDLGLIQPSRMENIVNGFSPVMPGGNSRHELGIPMNSLVFTLASRAIESKGWMVTLEAFRVVRERFTGRVDLHLQLIGDGPVADSFAAGPPVEGVHLVRHTARLADYIAASDVCVLPSWFPGESLPLVLIEFLAQGKPAIVSDIGRCAWAIGVDAKGGPAGLVVDRNAVTGKVDVDVLIGALERFANEPEMSRRLEPAALRAFRKFNMDYMLARYKQLFSELV